MTAIIMGIMLVGFSFTFFALPFAGIDLLIDAVGYLLIFNAVRPLRKLYPAFKGSVSTSLLLVVVSSLELFFPWGPLYAIRAMADAFLLLCLARGFYRLFCQQDKLAVGRVIATVLGLNAAASLGAALANVMGLPQAGLLQGACALAHWMLIFTLLVLLVKPPLLTND